MCMCIYIPLFCLFFFFVVVVATNFFRNSTAHDVEHKN